MRYFQQIAAGVEVLPLVLDLYRQPELWDQNKARTGGAGSFEGTSDIWVRFREPAELVSREAFAEPFWPVWYPAWHALPHLRPIVFGLMARLEAAQLGGVLITRVPGGQQVAPHDDRGRWHPEFFRTKAYLPLASNDHCYNTCGNERVVMKVGEAWLFDNLEMHSTVNDGETDRITLIVSMRVE
jgi:Aspartyl/Asparaginyl beta-hydroxylase